MDEIKFLLFLFLSLAGWIFFMVYVGERSTGAWIFLGILVVATAAVSLIVRKENPELLLRALLLTALLFSIPAGMLWLYTRDRVAGIVTAVSTPIAIIISIWVLRRRRPEAAPLRDSVMPHSDADRGAR